MPSKPLPAPMRRFLLICSLASTPAWIGCGHLAPPRPEPLQAEVPAAIQQPCPRPDKTGVRTLGDLATFAIAGEADLKVCDGYRAAAVEIVRAQNLAATAVAKATEPKPWWKFW